MTACTTGSNVTTCKKDMLLLSTETATATETKSENSPEDELEKRSEAEVKAVEREDAVDLSIKDHVDEVL